MPLGDFNDPSTEIPILERCISAWFGGALPVRVVSQMSQKRLLSFEHRVDSDGQLQLKTGPLHAHLESIKSRGDFVVLGFTNTDLYPGDEWNFVFGEANHATGTGLFSFARYRAPGDLAATARRSCGVLLHELIHLFGVRHCVFFECLTNGSNSLAESDARPWRPCPVDLRKLHWALAPVGGLDLAAREAALARLCEDLGMHPQAEWHRAHLAALQSAARF